MSVATIYIPERFKRVIHLHIIKNMLTHTSTNPALFLGIHGPSGDGKPINVSRC